MIFLKKISYASKIRFGDVVTPPKDKPAPAYPERAYGFTILIWCGRINVILS